MALVLNTRPADQNAALSAKLKAAGFEPLEIPMVDIEADPEGLDRLRHLHPGRFTGVFLSSPNGLRFMAAELLPADLEPWMAKPFYLVGPKAGELVRRHGGQVAFHPAEASLDGFLKEFAPAAQGNAGVTGLVLAQRWLHPCSTATRLDPAAFRKKGIEVENVPVYRPGANPDAAGLLAKGAAGLDAVVFSSGSAVAHFFAVAPPELAGRLGKKDGVLAVSIGPSTTQALIEKGVEQPCEAAQADDAGLVDALKQAFGTRGTKILARPKAPQPSEKKP